MLKSLERLDRGSFWMWTLALIAAHIGLAVVIVPGMSAAVTIDIVILIFLAIVLAGRFRDIGWPAWIGPTFLIGTTAIPPFVAIGVAIATRAAPAALSQWINLIILFTAPTNLALLVIAGMVPGKVAAAEPATDSGPELASQQGATGSGT